VKNLIKSLIQVSLLEVVLAAITLTMAFTLVFFSKTVFMFKFSFLLGSFLFLFMIFFTGTFLRKKNAFLSQIFKDQDASFKQISSSFNGWMILGVVALSLMVELSLIRLHYSTFGIFGYYKNMSLMACFLGLGVGYAMKPNRPFYIFLVLPALAIQFSILYFLRFTELRSILNNPVVEIYTHGMLPAKSIPPLIFSYGFLLTIFILTALTLLPFGQLAAHLMDKRDKLSAYGWNLGGSIVGVVLFSVLCFIPVPPQVWLLFVTVPLIIIIKSRVMIIWGNIILSIAIAILSFPFSKTKLDIYSPYQLISYQNHPQQIATLEANNIYYQWFLDLREKAIVTSEEMQSWANYYNLPYLIAPNKQSVLIVGSGTGNDVAAALRMGVQQIDAVEIDPVIKDYGDRFHPEKPYSNPKVRSFVDDARNFIRTTDKKYDMIIYGLLDSHVSFSSLSNVRIDSFVYTVEAFQEARNLLSERGLIFLSFGFISKLHAEKFYRMLAHAFDGIPPKVFMSSHPTRANRFTYAIGPGLSFLKAPSLKTVRDVSQPISEMKAFPDPSMDDWPFIYMPKRIYPLSYLFLNFLIFCIGLVFIKQNLTQKKSWFDPAFFFLGAGFMLLETKAITELGLVFGSTWIVVNIAILYVLIMAYLANWVVISMKGQTNLWFGLTMIILSLAAGYLYSHNMVHLLDPILAKIALPVLLTVPVFFSGLVFSGLFAIRGTVSSAMASNLLGVLVGGLLEYNALYFGYRSLYLFAIGMYIAAFFLMKKNIKGLEAY